VEEEFRHGQELVPILLHLEVDQIALSKTWDQQRKNKNVTHRIVVRFIIYIFLSLPFLRCLLVESDILVFSPVNESTKYKVSTKKSFQEHLYRVIA